MKFRKILAVLLVLVMCFTLIACGEKTGDNINDIPSTNKETVSDEIKNEEPTTSDSSGSNTDKEEKPSGDKEPVTDNGQGNVEKPVETKGITPLLYKRMDCLMFSVPRKVRSRLGSPFCYI